MEIENNIRGGALNSRGTLLKTGSTDKVAFAIDESEPHELAQSLSTINCGPLQVFNFYLKVFIFLTGFGILFYDTLLHTIRVIFSVEGSHGLLIALVSLYLVWLKRRHLGQHCYKAGLFTGNMLIGFGCLLLVIGKLSSTILLQQIAILPTLLGAALLFGGSECLKNFWVPIAYLVFLTGFAEELLGNVAIYLQIISAQIASQLLKLFGMSVLNIGTIIELPHIILQVVRLCSGINHIVALIALAVPLALTMLKSQIQRCILITAAFFIGIFLNGMRIALIGIYTLYNPHGQVHGPGGTLYVTFIFTFGIFVVIILSHILSRFDTTQHKRFSGPPKHFDAGFWHTGSPRQYQKIIPLASLHLGSVVACIGIFAASIGFINLYSPMAVSLKYPLKTFPGEIGGFIAKDLDEIDTFFRPLIADDELIRTYEDDDKTQIEVYIGYLNIQMPGREIIDYRRDWMHNDVVEVPVLMSTNSIYINRTKLQRKNDNRNVYFWYDFDGDIITSRYRGKLRLFLDALVHRKTNGAVVVINTRNTQNDIMPFIREFLKITQNYFSRT